MGTRGVGVIPHRVISCTTHVHALKRMHVFGGYVSMSVRLSVRLYICLLVCLFVTLLACVFAGVWEEVVCVYRGTSCMCVCV